MLQNSTFLEVFRIFLKNNVISVKAAKVIIIISSSSSRAYIAKKF
jgi:hypothetical protein